MNSNDYKISYSACNAVADKNVVAAKMIPTAKITMKGNYKGTYSYQYSIVPKDLGTVTMEVADKQYSTKANAWKSAVKLIDEDGKALAANKDYDGKNIEYRYVNDSVVKNGNSEYDRRAGSLVSAGDIPSSGTKIKATVKSVGANYSGEVSGEYEITDALISKAKVTLRTNSFEYTGKRIIPKQEAIDSVVLAGTSLRPGEDYEILSYGANVQKGTGTMVLKGKGNYGGTVTVKFKIVARKIKLFRFFSWN